MEEFNVLLWDINADKLVHYNVLPYFRRELRDSKLDLTNYEEFKKFIVSRSRYRYWARCEYEMICHGWPVRKNDYKLDVHEQIMMNIDVIAKMLYYEHNNA